MIRATTFAGASVAVFGMARSGIAAAEALRAGGATILAADDGAAGQARAEAAGFAPTDLRTADWSRIAALVLAPGVPLTHPMPHWTVTAAHAAGVPVIGDTELFVRELAAFTAAQGLTADRAPKLVAITGTNGKSTTTALTAHILAAAGRDVSMGGNIGLPILSLDPIEAGRTYVVEFSSYQIDLTPSLKPASSALLNITPDHLDRHGTLENYAAVKARLFARQGNGDTAVISLDDALCRRIAAGLSPACDVRHISVLGPVDDGTYATPPEFVGPGAGFALHRMDQGREVATLDLAGIVSLRGAHNAQNAAAASELLMPLGLSAAEIQAGLRSFGGLAHRMEVLGSAGPLLFVNDSKATNADAAAHALQAFRNIHWIAGGRAKEGGIAPLVPLMDHVAHAYLIGESAEQLAAQLPDDLPRTLLANVKEAVSAATRGAEASVAAGAEEAVVLLSPACASFDQFPDFEARGRAFADAVAALGTVVPLGRADPREPSASQPSGRPGP